MAISTADRFINRGFNVLHEVNPKPVVVLEKVWQSPRKLTSTQILVPKGFTLSRVTRASSLKVEGRAATTATLRVAKVLKTKLGCMIVLDWERQW